MTMKPGQPGKPSAGSSKPGSSPAKPRNWPTKPGQPTKK